MPLGGAVLVSSGAPVARCRVTVPLDRRAMPLLKGNLHTHTVLSDGTLSPEAVLAAYRERGYDFLAFTDHSSLLGPGGERAYWARLPASTPDFVVLLGIEDQPPELGGRHVGRIVAPNEVLRIVNHPNVYALSVREVAEAVARIGADCVEVTHHGRHLAIFDTDEIPVPKIATDDAHHAREIGLAWIELEAPRDPDAIVRAIKAGDFERVVEGRRYK